MAYSTSTPPILLQDQIGGGGAVWRYQTTDAITVVVGSNYFSNGEDLGMKAGDLVNVFVSGTPMLHPCFVSEVSSDGATVVRVTATAAA